MTRVAEARDVTVRAGAAVLLAGVSLAVAAGECVALVGPNGAGKSTLLRVLSGEIRPTVGDAYLKGRRLADYDARALARERAVLPQSVQVAFPFLVDEVVRMGAGDRRGAFVEDAVASSLAQAGVTHLRERLITTLSGGEQQRVHFARVLVQLACAEAERGGGLLLLDEPTSSLDLRHQLDLLSSVRTRARRGTAVVAILHDLNLASVFADRVVMLSAGRIAGQGAAAETITDRRLARVFDVRAAVNRVPSADQPFVLPHQAV